MLFTKDIISYSEVGERNIVVSGLSDQSESKGLPQLCRGHTARFFRVGRLFGADFPKIGQCEHKNR